jgi:hypothetical protein
MKLGEFNGIDEDLVYVHPDSDATERNLVEFVANDKQWLASPINISARNLTVQTTFRLYMKVDGTNYDRRMGSGSVGGEIVWNPGDGAWISFLLSGIADHDVKVTIQSGGSGEPAPVNVPVSYNAAQ